MCRRAPVVYQARLCPLARSIDRHTLTVRRTLVLPRLWETGRSQERPRAAAGEWPLIKESQGNLTYSHHRHSLNEASDRSQRTIIHVRVHGIRERGRSGGQRRLPVQRVGCVLSRRTRHNGSCLTDSKDDAVQREGGTIVVETQRMKKSRSTSTPAPLLRWIFRRGDRALTCQLVRETDHRTPCRLSLTGTSRAPRLKCSMRASPRFDGMLRLRRIYAEAAGRWWSTERLRDRGSRTRVARRAVAQRHFQLPFESG